MPYSAPQTASASADSSELITVDSKCRIRSGDASLNAWSSRPAGLMMWGAVIVMVPFESAVRGSLERSRDGRASLCRHAANDHADRATPLSGTPLGSADLTIHRRH